MNASVQVGRDGEEVPARLDEPEEEQEKLDEDDEDLHGELPSYYDGRWFHNGQWHQLKQPEP